MSGTFFLAAALFLGWLLSPEALVLTSNLAGTGGSFSPLLLSAACLLTFGCLLLSHYQHEEKEATTLEVVFLHSFGIAAAYSLAILLPTGVLVTAGFTFNETFLYWFPNFGFSAILLLLILLLHLFGDRAVENAQRIFGSITLLGLFIIILVGLLSPAEALTESAADTTTPQYLKVFAASLLLFLGGYHMPLKKISPIRLFLILAGGAVILSLWQITALKYVAGEKLASSTIPYIFVAREAMGQTGRVIIGITIIFGTLAVVNYLFFMATKQTRQLLSSTVDIEHREQFVGRIVALLLSIAIAISLASGLAGEDHLEMYIYGALLIWLMSAAAQVCIGWLRAGNIVYLLFPAVLLFALLYLTISHEDSISLVIFSALALCPSFIFSAAVILIGKRINQQLQ